MQSRRDQVQAHLFVMSRLASAMLRTDPDAPETPLGRTSKGAMGGLAIGVVIGLVIAVYGMIRPGGSTSWQKPGTLVVVKGTGARYLYVDGTLRPVLNTTSARLLAGTQLTVQQVDERSLGSTPRGAPLGVIGAPDSLPGQGSLSRGPWLACSVGEPPSAGSGPPQLSLAIGQPGTGRPVTGDEGVLVFGPDGARYLLWRGSRLRLDVAHGAVQALGYDAEAALPVSAAFLDAFPAGPDLGPPAVDSRGSPGPVLSGRATRIGELFIGAGNDRYVLLPAGLSPLTDIEYRLLSSDPRTQELAYARGSVAPGAVGPGDLAAHRAPEMPMRQSTRETLPATPPTLVAVPAGQVVCAAVRPSPDGAPATGTTVVAASSVAGQAVATQPGLQASCRQADQIAVQPGTGALIRALSSGGTDTTLYLVTDSGVKYPMPESGAKQLGYDAASAVRLPSPLLALLPSGPSLNPDAVAGGGLPDPGWRGYPCRD